MPSKKKAQDLAARGGAEALDLNACFEGRDEGHRDRNWLESPYRFEKDPHWNELGNRLAAACLDELLRRQAGLPPLAEVARDAALAEYYAAFERPSPLGEIAGERIRREYQAFGGLDAADAPSRVFSPDDLAIDSDYYDVYFDGLRLVFVKDACDADGDAVPFRVHATPVDANTLAPNASYFRLHHRTWLRGEGRGEGQGGRQERRCMAVVPFR